MFEKSLDVEISEISQGGSHLDIDESLRGMTIAVSGFSDVTEDILILAIERLKHKD